MATRKNLLIDDTIAALAQQWADTDNTTFTQVVHAAIKYYSDYRYLGENATLINQDITKTFDARIALLETKLNNKSNKLLSEMAIQEGILCMVIAKGLDVTPEQLDKYRRIMVDFLQENNRVLRLSEAVSDA